MPRNFLQLVFLRWTILFGSQRAGFIEMGRVSIAHQIKIQKRNCRNINSKYFDQVMLIRSELDYWKELYEYNIGGFQWILFALNGITNLIHRQPCTWINMKLSEKYKFIVTVCITRNSFSWIITANLKPLSFAPEYLKLYSNCKNIFECDEHTYICQNIYIKLQSNYFIFKN